MCRPLDHRGERPREYRLDFPTAPSRPCETGQHPAFRCRGVRLRETARSSTFGQSLSASRLSDVNSVEWNSAERIRLEADQRLANHGIAHGIVHEKSGSLVIEDLLGLLIK